ncbi:MAG: DUF3786 domain-containing protein [Bacillota bacterium]
MTRLNLRLETLQKLKGLTGKNQYKFLGFSLDLEKSTLTDCLPQPTGLNEWANQILTTLLCHYSLATPISPTGKLVKYKDIPGGHAFEDAFVKRAIEPVAEVFGQKPHKLVESAKLLCGTKLNLGDASVEIPALKGIPLTYILWGKEEFPASANILFDATASCYLPTEDLAVLGELCTLRLKEARKNFFVP